MREKSREGIEIVREQGVLERAGKGFHNPSSFAEENLMHAVWSETYVCDKRYYVRREYLNFYSLIYVIQGSMQFELGDESIKVCENEAILIDFRIPHHYYSTSDKMKKWELIFDGGMAEAFYNLIVGSWGHMFAVTGRLKSLVEALMEELEKPLPDDLLLGLHLYSLFTYIAEDHQQKLSAPIQKAMDYMTEFADQAIQVNEVADYVGLSRSYFSRLFCKETGHPPYEYLMGVRINMAKQILAKGTYSVAEVAEKCGFVNVSHFTRAFRNKTGQTPASFRTQFHNFIPTKEHDFIPEEA